jgi:hypothetical protein
MALVLTVAQKDQIVSQFDSSKRLILATAAFDNSYPTGGETVIKSQIGLKTIDSILAFPSNGYVFQYDSAANKLKAYWADNAALAASALVEVTNTTDLSGVTAAQLLIVGDVA